MRSEFDPDQKQLDLQIGFARGSRFACPACGAELFEALLSPARETRNGVAVRVVNGWSNPKRTFDKSVEGVAAWTLHDLRRTFATNLAALRRPVHVTEKLLNHVSGSVSGVAAIYNRHAYMDEMRTAIADRVRRLAEIVELS